MKLQTLFSVKNKKNITNVWPASMAQLDARPTGDQEVASLIPVGLVTFFRGNCS